MEETTVCKKTRPYKRRKWYSYRKYSALKYATNMLDNIIGRLFYFAVVISLIVWLYLIALT
jgi:hypothetical protein